MKHKSVWVPFDLDAIIHLFLKDIGHKDGKVESYDFYIDPFKGKVIVKLWVEKERECQDEKSIDGNPDGSDV